MGHSDRGTLSTVRGFEVGMLVGDQVGRSVGKFGGDEFGAPVG